MSDANDKTPPGDGAFEPKVTAFVCNWCTYAGADLTGTSRIRYAHNVRVIRVPCSGRIDFMLPLKAFGRGADAVIVSGCHPGDCHYTSGNYHARRRWMLFRELLGFLGFDSRRLHFSWVSAAEGAKWAELVTSVVDETRKLGPYAEYRQIADSALAAAQTAARLAEESAALAKEPCEHAAALEPTGTGD